MTHVRQQIREAVIPLVVASGVAAANVRESRRYPHAKDALPAATVFSETETVQRDDMGGGLARELALKVRFFRRDTAQGLEDGLDQMAADFEAQWGANPTLGGLAADSVLSEVEFDIATDGDTDIGAVTLEYRVLYYTNQSNAEATI